MEKVQVEILGLSNAPNSQGAFALILKESGGKRQLPIIIGANEAQAIAIEIENIKPPRPLTHDLFQNILDQLGVTIVEVFINELKDGTFYSIITLADDGENFEIDSRPSDAIAIALRAGAPIYVEEEIIEEAGITYIPDDEIQKIEKMLHTATKTKVNPTTILEKLQKDLENAINSEDYELAVKLRDQIKKLTLNS